MTRRILTFTGGEDYTPNDLSGAGAAGTVDSFNTVSSGFGEVLSVTHATTFTVTRLQTPWTCSPNGLGTPGGQKVIWRAPTATVTLGTYLIHSISVVPTYGEDDTSTSTATVGQVNWEVWWTQASSVFGCQYLCGCYTAASDWFYSSEAGATLFTPFDNSTTYGAMNGVGPRGLAGTSGSSAAGSALGGANGPWQLRMPGVGSANPSHTADSLCVFFYSNGSYIKFGQFDISVTMTYVPNWNPPLE